MRYTLVNQESGLVANVLEIDDVQGWAVPDGYLLIASGEANIGDRYDAASKTFTAPQPSATPAPTERDYILAVQAVLDAMAQERNYDNIATAASYAGDPDPTFNAEGAALRNWRSAVWRYCYLQLDQVNKGEIAQPTVAAFTQSLPAFSWPD